MKNQIMNLVLAAIFTVIISSGFSAIAQTGSIDRESPEPIMSRSITSTVSSDLGDYQEIFYSIEVRKGYMTVDLSALARDGMNITLGIEGSGVFEAIGPLASGGDDRMSGTVRFKVPSRQTLIINV